MAQQTGERMDGLYGLAGLGACESFADLETAASEAGVPDAGKIASTLRRKHSCACKRLREALPVAMDVKTMLERVVGDGPTPVMAQLGALTLRNYLESAPAALTPIADFYVGELGALGASPAKALKKAQKTATKTAAKIAKVQAKEAKQEAKIAAKVAKLQAAGKTAKAAKVIAKDAKQDAKVAAKLVKLDTKLQAAQAAVATAAQAAATPITPAAVTTPTETAAAVLANQAGVQATTPAAQQLMQEVVANATQPGSTLPAQSLTTSFMPYPQSSGGDYAPTAAPAESGGFFDNVSPVVLVGGGVALLLIVPKLLGKRR